MKVSTMPSPLMKVYDGLSNQALLDGLREFEHARGSSSADEHFYLARIDTITAILRGRGIDPAAPPLFAEVPS